MWGDCLGADPTSSFTLIMNRKSKARFGVLGALRRSLPGVVGCLARHDRLWVRLGVAAGLGFGMAQPLSAQTI